MPLGGRLGYFLRHSVDIDVTEGRKDIANQPFFLAFGIGIASFRRFLVEPRRDDPFKGTRNFWSTFLPVSGKPTLKSEIPKVR